MARSGTDAALGKRRRPDRRIGGCLAAALCDTVLSDRGADTWSGPLLRGLCTRMRTGRTTHVENRQITELLSERPELPGLADAAVDAFESARVRNDGGVLWVTNTVGRADAAALEAMPQVVDAFCRAMADGHPHVSEVRFLQECRKHLSEREEPLRDGTAAAKLLRTLCSYLEEDPAAYQTGPASWVLRDHGDEEWVEPIRAALSMS